MCLWFAGKPGSVQSICPNQIVVRITEILKGKKFSIACLNDHSVIQLMHTSDPRTMEERQYRHDHVYIHKVHGPARTLM